MFSERKVSHVRTRKTQPYFISLTNEYCSGRCISLRYRGAKPINCLLETGFGRVDFLRRVERKILRRATCNSKNSQQFFSMGFHYVLLHYLGPIFCWRVCTDEVLDVMFSNINTVVCKFVFFDWLSSVQLNSSFWHYNAGLTTVQLVDFRTLQFSYLELRVSDSANSKLWTEKPVLIYFHNKPHTIEMQESFFYRLSEIAILYTRNIVKFPSHLKTLEMKLKEDGRRAPAHFSPNYIFCSKFANA